MNIIITGASGFIGQHLVQAIHAECNHIYCVTRNSSSHKNDEKKTWLSWDDINNDFFRNNNINAVIHLATAYGRRDNVSNVEYANVYRPLRILELCADFSVAFINTDSFFTKPELNCGYMKPYVMTKVAFLSWARYFVSQNYDFKFINMRLEHVYGPHDSSDKFVSFMCNELKINGNRIKCTDGFQKRDFVYVKDVVAAYKKVVEHLPLLNAGISEYQIGTGKSIMIREFIETLKSSLNAKNVDILYGEIETRIDEIMDSQADITALRHLGWVVKYSILDGINDMIKTETK